MSFVTEVSPLGRSMAVAESMCRYSSHDENLRGDGLGDGGGFILSSGYASG